MQRGGRDKVGMTVQLPNAKTPRDWDAIWSGARARLRQELGEAVFEAWIGPLSFLGETNGIVSIGAPKPFTRNWVAKHYTAKIERALRDEGGEPASIEYRLALSRPAVIPGGHLRERETAPPAPMPAPPAPAHARDTSVGLWDRVLDPNQSFDSFVTGPGNEFALKAVRALAEDPAADIGLVFLHGGFGYGKTHLLNAAALELRSRHRRALFLRAEDFMRHFLGALRRQETLAFKDALRVADVLIIDDLQHICGRAATIAEFLHTVNAFADLRRKVIVAADREPNALDGLGPDIRSRLSGGLTVALDKPDRETRLAILKARAAQFARNRPDSTLGDDVLARIADTVDASPRELIGIYLKLATYSDLTKKPVTIGVAEEALGQRTAPGARKTSIEDIQRKTAEFYKLDIRDLHSPRRTRRVARPRQVAMFLARELTMRSLPEIGKRFGGRDHTTVLHACRRVQELCDEDPVFKQEVDFLRQVLARGGTA